MTFELHQPDSVAEAVRLAGALQPEARFLAGGTDLIIQINRKRCVPRHLIALDRIDGLCGIDSAAQEIRIGALTTHKMIEQHPGFSGRLVALQEAARVIGGHQVRNVATIGGNIVNASPAADLVPVLLALDAELLLHGVAGPRRVKLALFLRGPGLTDRAVDEVLLGVAFARAGDGAASAFIKLGRRRAMEISIVCVAALLDCDAAGRCTDVRIALGAVGPTALRAVAAEQSLQGRIPTDAALREAGMLAMSACAAISDVRASAEYRRMLVQTLVPRALRRCLERRETASA
jgi:carbon-monoxide dehydrogenase medium subunit